MTQSAASWIGKLHIHAGAEQPLIRSDGAVTGQRLRRLLAGRNAAGVPELLGLLFTLCGTQQKQTAQRALLAAQTGRSESVHDPALATACLHEHFVHLALHLPRTFPLQGLPSTAHAASAFAQEYVLGLSGADWLARYAAPGGATAWAKAYSGKLLVARWLEEIRERASALPLALELVSPLDTPQRDLPLLAASMLGDAPLELHGQPIASGAFNRAALPLGARQARNAYDLLVARVVDLARLTQPEPWLRAGALALGPGEAIAYSELTRGLVLHWVKLSLPALARGVAVVDDYRVLTPTDLCLHPRGALATCLRRPGLTPHDVALLLAAFDPCLEVEVTCTK